MENKEKNNHLLVDLYNGRREILKLKIVFGFAFSNEGYGIDEESTSKILDEVEDIIGIKNIDKKYIENIEEKNELLDYGYTIIYFIWNWFIINKYDSDKNNNKDEWINCVKLFKGMINYLTK